jgi:hypothetical protein
MASAAAAKQAVDPQWHCIIRQFLVKGRSPDSIQRCLELKAISFATVPSKCSVRQAAQAGKTSSRVMPLTLHFRIGGMEPHCPSSLMVETAVQFLLDRSCCVSRCNSYCALYVATEDLLCSLCCCSTGHAGLAADADQNVQDDLAGKGCAAVIATCP